MSKSRNFRRNDFYYEDDYRTISRKDLRKLQNKRNEKKLNSALKSRDLSTLYSIRSWKE